MNLKAIWQLLQEAFQEWNDDKASRLAAALAYYTVFSIAPLLIIVIAIAGAVFGQDAARGEIVQQIQGLVGKDGAEFIQTAIQNANKPRTGTIASLSSLGFTTLPKFSSSALSLPKFTPGDTADALYQIVTPCL